MSNNPLNIVLDEAQLSPGYLPAGYVPPPLQLTNEDGNVYSIVGRAKRAMERSGQDKHWFVYFQLIRSGDYDHALQVTMTWFEYCVNRVSAGQLRNGDVFTIGEREGPCWATLLLIHNHSGSDVKFGQVVSLECLCVSVGLFTSLHEGYVSIVPFRSESTVNLHAPRQEQLILC